MTNASSEAVLYDPEHPWFRDELDDPSRANWVSEFTDPTGQTRKPVFLRGQSFLAILRTVIFMAALVVSGSSPWVGAAIGAIGLFLLLMASLVSHVRRLNDSGRSSLLAAIITLPLIVALALGAIGAASAPARLEAMKAKQEPAKAAASSTVNTSTEEEASASTPAEVDQEQPTKKPPARRGPPKPMTIETVLSGVVSSSLMLWLLLSIGTSFFSFLYVARGRSMSDQKPDTSQVIRPQPAYRPGLH